MTKARDLANASTALSAVSATELAFVDGVTSAIQTQMDGKIAKTLTTTTGDIIYASGANTPARLGIGTTGQVLNVASGVPAWATVSGGSMTELASGSFPTNVTTFTLSSISGSYKSLRLIVRSLRNASGTADYRLRFNSDAGAKYFQAATTASGNGNAADYDECNLSYSPVLNYTDGTLIIDVPDYANTTTTKTLTSLMFFQDQPTPTYSLRNIRGSYRNNAAITAITIFDNTTVNFSGGTYILYGVN